MGYFPNGTAGMFYEEQYCDRCIHQNGPDEKSGCAVWLAHMLHNYKECNNKESILHLLIPLGKDGENKKCLMFHLNKAEEDEAKRAAEELEKYQKVMQLK